MPGRCAIVENGGKPTLILIGNMSQPGRGYDLTNVSPTAYDKLIFGFVGITGFRKIDKEDRD
ncbi:hypothetical protein MJM95_29370, partial [Salmonella enterica subsp. enterica serovar Anatum]|nr:hypothetical protein [Salmonella enterica subsp. enterica serovar Anatum]